MAEIDPAAADSGLASGLGRRIAALRKLQGLTILNQSIL
jgi:hypothetical protein